MMLSRFVNEVLSGLSSLLVWFGLGLLVLGGTIQVVRERQLARAEAESPPPRFERSVAPIERLPTAAPEATATPGPPPERIVIPSLKLDVPVVEVGWEARIVNGEAAGNIWQTADYAAGYHKTSVRPGEPGNLVLSGHNNIAGKVFAAVPDLEPGDRIYLEAGGASFPYVVEEKFVVQEEGASDEERRENARWIGDTPDERLTLVTCYPPWSNTHRAIVVARPAPDDGRAAPNDVAVR
jgi:sortase A